METLAAETLTADALLLVDTAPIIYVLEGHATLGPRFAPLFARHARHELALAVTTITIAEVLTGPLAAGEETLAERYRTTLQSWRIVELDVGIAERAARLRTTYHLRLPDAIQLASALAIHADALVTHDRDFAKVRGLRILA